jgi:two-component system, NtrC family, nitrogen regulation sensor histidine kinase NtrY
MRSLTRIWHRYRRENRFLLTTFLVLMVLGVGAFYLVQRTQEASPEELTNRLLLFILWYLDISLILILTFILARNLIHLFVESRSGVLGSRFRTKLVLTYVGLTFVPVIFIFLIATNFLQRSIDRWFSAPVEETLRSGAAATVGVRELVEERLQHQAEVAAGDLAPHPSAARLPALRSLMGVDLIALYEDSRLVQAVSDPRRIPSSLPSLRWENLAPSGVRSDRWRGGLLVRAWAPIAGDAVVVVGDMLPRDLLLHLERATAADATFQEMKLQRGTVTATTVLVFLAFTLLLLFATVWIGLYLSRRFTEPLLEVAAATQRVAEGSQLEEVAAPGSDEVAVLVHSFNAMVRRVKATEAEILASNQELATLLATVPTGVLTLDWRGRRVRPNPAAARILGHQEWASQWLDLDLLNRPGLEELYRRLRPDTSRDVRSELELEVDGVTRQLDIAMEALPGGGSVVTIDDLTQLVRAQRQAAWSEVAQRIAHEIKNPLTPIRLAAERMQRWATRLDGDLRDIMTSGCEAIVAQVTGLKELVDAFRQYARMPGVTPRPSSVTQIVHEVGSLYGALREDLELIVDLPPEEITAVVDPVLLRQALVNLLDNASEAVTGAGTVTLAARREAETVVLEVADTGVGLPTEDAELLLQPFFSTKGRGSGMGLALVHRIVTDHGGRLELENLPGGGAVARIVLPATLVAAERISSAATGRSGPRDQGAPPRDGAR